MLASFATHYLNVNVMNAHLNTQMKNLNVSKYHKLSTALEVENAYLALSAKCMLLEELVHSKLEEEMQDFKSFLNSVAQQCNLANHLLKQQFEADSNP